jgi:hypothetical protein
MTTHRCREDTLRDRFFQFAHVPEDLNHCWTWTGTLKSNGQGQIGTHRGTETAHRVSWRLHNPEADAQVIMETHYVRHTCGCPSCVNPAHLKLVRIKSRSSTPEVPAGRPGRPRNGGLPNTYLSEENVRAIRNDPRSLTEIGRAFNIAPSYVSRIKRGVVWRHVVDVPSERSCSLDVEMTTPEIIAFMQRTAANAA